MSERGRPSRSAHGEAPGNGQRRKLEPCLERLGAPTGSLERRLDVRFRHAVPLTQVGRPVGGYCAEAQPADVHPLDVDGRQRSLELARNLDCDRDATAGHTDDHRLVELERSDGLGQGAPSGGTITEERRDPRDEAHVLIVPGPLSREGASTAEEGPEALLEFPVVPRSTGVSADR